MYVPVRVLEKELELAGEGVSVVRYVIDWAAEESTERVFGAPDFFIDIEWGSRLNCGDYRV